MRIERPETVGDVQRNPVADVMQNKTSPIASRCRVSYRLMHVQNGIINGAQLGQKGENWFCESFQLFLSRLPQ